MGNNISKDYFYPHGREGICTADNFVLCLVIPGLLWAGLGMAYTAYTSLINLGSACLAFALVVYRLRRPPVRILSVNNNQIIYTPTELGFACRDVILPFSSIEKIEIDYETYKNGPRRYYFRIVTKARKTYELHNEFFHNPGDLAELKAFFIGKCLVREKQ